MLLIEKRGIGALSCTMSVCISWGYVDSTEKKKTHLLLSFNFFGF